MLLLNTPAAAGFSTVFSTIAWLVDKLILYPVNIPTKYPINIRNLLITAYTILDDVYL